MVAVNGDWRDQILHFKVMDKDLIFDDVIGYAELPLKDVLLDCVVSHVVLDLVNPKKDNAKHGKLYVSLDGINCGGQPLPQVIESANAAVPSTVVLNEGTDILEEPPK